MRWQLTVTGGLTLLFFPFLSPVTGGHGLRSLTVHGGELQSVASQAPLRLPGLFRTLRQVARLPTQLDPSVVALAELLLARPAPTPAALRAPPRSPAAAPPQPNRLTHLTLLGLPAVRSGSVWELLAGLETVEVDWPSSGRLPMRADALPALRAMRWRATADARAGVGSGWDSQRLAHWDAQAFAQRVEFLLETYGALEMVEIDQALWDSCTALRQAGVEKAVARRGVELVVV